MRVSMMFVVFLSPALLFSGCETLEYEAYYQNPEEGPRIFELRDGQASEEGNLGGQEVTIEGQNFGDDPEKTVVYFDSLNAEILEVSDEAIRVRSPRGPLQGGAVNVYVATENGIAQADEAYAYEVGDLFSEEVAHISAGNYWRSCLGGGEDLETADGQSVGCDSIAYNGHTGTTGSAEFYKFIFPRIHTQNVGFLWATDEPGLGEGWKVETPAQVAFSLAVDDLRKPVGNFKITNDAWEDKYWCANLDGLGQWVYGGGDGKAQKIIGGSVDLMNGKPRDSDYACDGELLPMSELRYCEVPEYGGAHSNEYEAFWPVGRSFFSGGNGNQGHTKAATVGLEVPGADISGVEVLLPEPLVVEMDEGMIPIADTPSLWGAGAGIDACFDDDGDANTDLDEVAFKFRWQPSGVSHGEDDAYAGQTRVRFALTIISVGWFGAESYPVRAAVSLPDRHEVVEIEDEESGELIEWSTLEVPASVMYQFPSTNISFYSEPSGGGGPGGGATGYTFGNPLEVGQGYFLVTADRVTEYAVPSDELGGDVVLSYSTGDFGFFGWDHPLDQDACGNCADDDGDGWADKDDPDCAGDSRELGFAVECTDDVGNPTACECHDGLDNDGDGGVDAQDPDCDSANDDQELVSPCVNGVDDDADGWIDEEDPECTDGAGFEAGFDADLECNDGVDNDGDGWVDRDDPICEAGEDPEDDVFSGTECNDGIDNDGHGDVDASDPLCQSKGASHDNERESTTKLDCMNGQDDDGDGFVDVGDPDCEFGPESITGVDPAGESTPECYDGEDNDGDGFIDAADTSCWNQAITCPDTDGDGNPDPACADGFLNDEGLLHPCDDGLDNDGDGWLDAADPECFDADDNTFGVSIGQEAGFGSAACNDGADNDGDLFVDSDDVGCADAVDDDEGA